MKDLSRALELDRDLAFAYANRGLTFMLLGKRSEALGDFEKFFELKPEMKTEIQGRIDLVDKLMRAKGAKAQ